MFLDSEPEEIFQLPRSGMPLKEKKRTATLLPATEKIYMFLSSSPSVTKGKPFFFILSRVAYVAILINQFVFLYDYSVKRSFIHLCLHKGG